jgi:hypothetical protein
LIQKEKDKIAKEFADKTVSKDEQVKSMKEERDKF